MAVPKPQPSYTVEEYLALEREAEERHEYLDGFIYAMADESQEHGEICANLSGTLVTQLRGTPCRARIANTKVRSGSQPMPPRSRRGLFSYPDLFVTCGEMNFHDDHKDVVINPTVVFEVLSESTEKFDRGEKFLRHQNWNPTLTDYVLISQTSPTIEHFTRQSDGSWSYRVYQGLKASFAIDSIACKLRLSDVYDRVKFTDDESKPAKKSKKNAGKKKKGRKKK